MLVKSSRFEDEIRKSAKKDPNNSFSQRYVTQHGITGVINAQNQITVAVGMFNVTARGAVINGLVPLVILNEYIKDFQEILQCLIDKSPIGKLMFLAQYQGDYEKVVCGTIPISEFFSLLAQKEILFNTYYILCK